MADARFRDTLKALLVALGSNDPARRQRARETIRDTLAASRRSWNDLVATFHFRGQHGDKLRKLFAMLGQDNDGECDNARQKISDLLAREKRSWSAFVGTLFSASAHPWSDWQDDSAAHGDINPLDLVHHLVQRYVALTDHQLVAVSLVAVSLWVVHTFVYHRFTATPRLTLTSPVRGCGKTTLLDLIEALCVRPLKSDSITAASIYHAVDREHPTLLIDEADNLGLAFNGPLRAVLNSGHRRGGKVMRYYSGQARSFSTFSPAAVAAIGTLPLPLMHRSITIHMQRRHGRELKRLDRNDADTRADLNIAYRMIFRWARDAEISSDPPLPAQLRNRQADNWRPLIAIADAFGADWATRAREAAVAFASEHQDEDAAILLLRDIRGIFGMRGVDRLPSKTIVDHLNGADDAMWSEWRGVLGDQQPRKLSQGEMAKLLEPFQIRPRTIRPYQAANKPTAKGYYRAQFEAAWRVYCTNGVTPSQPRNIRHLHGL
jgi:Protein of unknown function (DUF3631)